MGELELRFDRLDLDDRLEQLAGKAITDPVGSVSALFGFEVNAHLAEHLERGVGEMNSSCKTGARRIRQVSRSRSDFNGTKRSHKTHESKSDALMPSFHGVSWRIPRHGNAGGSPRGLWRVASRSTASAVGSRVHVPAQVRVCHEILLTEVEPTEAHRAQSSILATALAEVTGKRTQASILLA